MNFILEKHHFANFLLSIFHSQDGWMFKRLVGDPDLAVLGCTAVRRRSLGEPIRSSHQASLTRNRLTQKRGLSTIFLPSVGSGQLHLASPV